MVMHVLMKVEVRLVCLRGALSIVVVMEAPFVLGTVVGIVFFESVDSLGDSFFLSTVWEKDFFE